MAEDIYYLILDDKEQGPFTINQIRSMWNTGRLTLKTLYFQPGMTEWTPLATIKATIEPIVVPPPLPPPPSAYAFPARPIIIKAAKARWVFILLGLFLGTLGIHNFYAGYNQKGVTQLLIAVIGSLVVVGPIVSAIWAIIDICTITKDAEGVQFV